MLVRLIHQSYLWDDVIWERGSVLEVDDLVANYQIACKLMEAADKGTPKTPKPEPVMVTPKATPQATGEAIAKALSDTLGGGKSKKKAEEDEESDSENKKFKAKKGHDFET